MNARLIRRLLLSGCVLFSAVSVAAQPITTAAASAGRTINLPAAILGEPYTNALPLGSTEGRVTCQLLSGSLPSGLQLRERWLQGAATQPGDFTTIIKARDEIGQEATAQFSIRVVLPPAKPLSLPNRLLSACLICAPYDVTLPVQGGYPPYLWKTIEGKLPPGLVFQQGSITGMVRQAVMSETRYDFAVQVKDSLGFFASNKFSLVLSPNPQIVLRVEAPSSGSSTGSTISLPSAVVGQPYAARLPIHGGFGATHFSLTGELPSPLKLVNHTVTGVPTRPGDSTFAIIAQDELDQKIEGRFTLHVLPPSPPPLKIATSDLPSALLAENYTSVLRAEGGLGPYRWNVVKGSLPKWAVLQGDLIQGVPARVSDLGESRIEVKVSDSTGIEVGPMPLTIRTLANKRFSPPKIPALVLPDGVTAKPYQASIRIVGGLPPYSVESTGSPVPGLKVDSVGDLQGIPQKAGTFDLALRVTDSLGQASATEKIGLRILTPPTASPNNGGPTGVGLTTNVSALRPFTPNRLANESAQLAMSNHMPGDKPILYLWVPLSLILGLLLGFGAAWIRFRRIDRHSALRNQKD